MLYTNKLFLIPEKIEETVNEAIKEEDEEYKV